MSSHEGCGRDCRRCCRSGCRRGQVEVWTVSPLLMMDGGVTATRQLVAACSSLASPAVLAAAVLLALQSSNQLLTCSEQHTNIFSADPPPSWTPHSRWASTHQQGITSKSGGKKTCSRGSDFVINATGWWWSWWWWWGLSFTNNPWCLPSSHLAEIYSVLYLMAGHGDPTKPRRGSGQLLKVVKLVGNFFKPRETNWLFFHSQWFNLSRQCNSIYVYCISVS